MLIHVALLALKIAGPPVDTTEVYSTLLRDLRIAHPAAPIVLATNRSDVECMPHCGVTFRGETQPERPAAHTEHSAALRKRGLIQATCTAQPLRFGCGRPRGHRFVALGELRRCLPGGVQRVEGGIWVKVAVLEPVPDDGTEPDAYGIWYLLVQNADATWGVVRRQQAFQI